MASYRILMLNKPKGDRGPAIGYKHHYNALSGGVDFVIEELTRDIWSNDAILKSFDAAWAYVRFPKGFLEKCRALEIPFISGPNVVMERADRGINDNWESWFFKEANVDLNLNVAPYYANYVSTFMSGKTKCKTLEYCYELPLSLDDVNKFARNLDCLIYAKDRVNDKRTDNRVKLLQNELSRRNISHSVIWYGSYNREQYLDLCLKSKVVAWLSIEDYCSLAQIEAQLHGCCVTGTPYNLTIPILDEMLINGVQNIGASWIEWIEDDSLVAAKYADVIENALAIKDLPELAHFEAKKRHSYLNYCRNVAALLEDVMRTSI
jgi:hypothetical protein